MESGAPKLLGYTEKLFVDVFAIALLSLSPMFLLKCTVSQCNGWIIVSHTKHGLEQSIETRLTQEYAGNPFHYFLREPLKGGYP